MVASMVILLFGVWLGGTAGSSSGSRLIAGIIGFLTAAALYGVLKYGEEPENDRPPERPRSKLSFLVSAFFGIAAIGYIAMLLIRQFIYGMTYQGSVLIGFLFGVLVTAAFAHWQKRSTKRHQSA